MAMEPNAMVEVELDNLNSLRMKQNQKSKIGSEFILPISTGIEDFECEICHKSSKNKKCLQLHLKIHSDTPAIFWCDDCQKSFKEKRSLQRHKQVTHSQLRNHVCSVCGNTYKHVANFRRHMLYHTNTNEQDSKCPYCDNNDKKYNSAFSLRLHIRRCHPHPTTPTPSDVNVNMDKKKNKWWMNEVVVVGEEGQGQGQGLPQPQPQPLRELPRILQRQKREQKQ